MLIDSHCHIPSKYYEIDTSKVIEEALDNDVVKLINIGTSIQDISSTLEISSKYPNIYSALGIYPHEDMDVPLTELRDKLEEYISKDRASSKKIVGIGECGIDITDWQGGRKLEEQIELFEMQIQLAAKHQLPLVIHSRNADETVLSLLEKYKGQVIGVAHCFSSSWETAQRYLDLGFYLSFSGMITYKSRSELLETVRNVPEKSFVVETDAPYLPPQGHRGERNYPKYVKIVAEKIAETRNIAINEVCDLSYRNTCSLFKLNDC